MIATRRPLIAAITIGSPADILRVIGASMTDAKPVFEAIVRSCAELFGDGGISLRLLKNGGLEVQADQGYDSVPLLPIDRESAIGACVLEGRTIHLPDLEKAVEAIYNALSAQGEVARDQSDLGVIAVLAEHGYRPLKKELDAVGQ